MVLQNLKSIVEDSGTTARDVVLSVPPYWTDVQRRAMLDAADIVGLNVLRLMNDSTAVALAYGIFRNARNQFHETDSTNVMFVDVGHAASKVCIASFVKDRLVMRSCVCDANVGGRNFDMALVMHMANEFKSKTGLDVLSNHKALIKLKSECEKLKKVLSANSKQSINVECMMEERDFTSMLEREQLETLISPLVDKIVDCVHGALEQAGMTAFDIAAVEVVGGSTRIPLIKQRISEAMGKELSTTLNADEAVARGCALQCAILSPLFKVRDFEIHDIVPYDIRVSWEQESVIPSQDDEDSEPGENSLVIFARNSESPKTRKVAFRRTKPFQIASNYADPQQLPQGAASHLGIYTIEGIHARENEPVPKVKVFFRHNIHGIFSVHRAELVQEIIEDSTEASAKSMDTSGDESHNQPEQNSETTESENKDQAEATEAAEATEPPAKKKKYKREDLSVTGGIVYYTPDEKTNIIDEEARMAQQDRIIAETNEKRNALESYIYDTRNKLLEELQEYSTVEERSVLNTKLDEAENWLYDEGYDTTKSIYSSKLDDLMKLGQPIVQRKAENLERPQVVSELMAAVENYKAFASSQEEKYAHINDEDRSKVLAKCSEVEAWLSDLLNKQSELPPFVDAVLTVSEIRSQAQVFFLSFSLFPLYKFNNNIYIFKKANFFFLIKKNKCRAFITCAIQS